MMRIGFLPPNPSGVTIIHRGNPHQQTTVVWILRIDQLRRFVQARNLWPSEPPEFRAAAEAAGISVEAPGVAGGYVG